MHCTSKHISTHAHTPKTTANKGPTSSVQTLLCIFPRKPRPDDGGLILCIIDDIVKVLGGDEEPVLNAGEAIVGHVSTGLDRKQGINIMELLDDLRHLKSALGRGDTCWAKIAARGGPVVLQNIKKRNGQTILNCYSLLVKLGAYVCCCR